MQSFGYAGSSPFALPRKRAKWAMAAQEYTSCPCSTYASHVPALE